MLNPVTCALNPISAVCALLHCYYYAENLACKMLRPGVVCTIKACHTKSLLAVEVIQVQQLSTCIACTSTCRSALDVHQELVDNGQPSNITAVRARAEQHSDT
eukprot:13366-Heterococcus_DN1.PRE.7